MPEPEPSTLPPDSSADANILDPIVVSQDDPLSLISDEDPPSLIEVEDPEDTDGEAPAEVAPDVSAEGEALLEENPAAGEIADDDPAADEDLDDLQDGDGRRRRHRL